MSFSLHGTMLMTEKKNREEKKSSLEACGDESRNHFRKDRVMRQR